MSDGIVINLRAETGDAAARLQAFFDQMNASMAKVGAQAHAASEGMTKLRESSMVLKEGFHGLSESMLLLGGQHMQEMMAGVTALRMAMMTTRSASLLTGVSLATLGPIAGVVTAAIGLGALAWSSYAAETKQAAVESAKMAKTLEAMPKVIEAINSAHKTGIVSSEQANKWLDTLGARPKPGKAPDSALETAELAPAPTAEQMPTTSAKGPWESLWSLATGPKPVAQTDFGREFENVNHDVNAENLQKVQEEMSQAGVLQKVGTGDTAEFRDDPRVKQLEGIREIQKQIATEAVEGYERERVKAKQVYDEALARLTEQASVAGKFYNSDEFDKDKQGLKNNYNARVTDINNREQTETGQRSQEEESKRKTELSDEAAHQQEELERQLTLETAQEGGKRTANYEAEFQKRMELAKHLYGSAIIDLKQYTAMEKAATAKRLDAARREAEQKRQMAFEAQQDRIKALEDDRKLLDGRNDLTENQKEQATLTILARENVELTKMIELLAARAKAAAGTPEESKANRELTDAQFKLAQNNQQSSQISASGTFGGEFSKTLISLQDQWGSWAKQTANAFSSVFNSAVSTISNGITGLIMGTKTWGQALKQIGAGLLESFVHVVTEMVVRWTLTHVLMGGISKLFHAQETATQAVATTTQVGIHTTGEAAKTTATAGGVSARGVLRVFETIFHGMQVAIRVAMHVAGEIMCTLVSAAQQVIRIGLVLAETLIWLVKAAIQGMAAVSGIPYVGPILAIAALAAILGAGGAAIAGAFADGGRPNPGQLALVGERGPELFVPDTSGTILTAPVTAKILASQGGSGSRQPSGGANHISFAVLNDERKLPDWVRSQEFEAHLLDLNKKQHHRLK